MTATSAGTDGASAEGRNPLEGVTLDEAHGFVGFKGGRVPDPQPTVTEQLIRDVMEKIRSQRTNVVANAATAERLRARLEEAGMLHQVNILESEYVPDDTAFILPPQAQVKIEGESEARRHLRELSIPLAHSLHVE